jgi:hypothetical protein
MSSAGVWFVRGIGTQSHFIGKAPARSAPLHPPASPTISHSPASKPPPALSLITPPTTPPASPPPPESLHELEGCLDLVILSFLIQIGRSSPPHTSSSSSSSSPPSLAPLQSSSYPFHTQQCIHRSCPAICSQCIDENYKLWGEHEHMTSLDGKVARKAQKDAAILSQVCKRWYHHIRQPQQVCLPPPPTPQFQPLPLVSEQAAVDPARAARGHR